MARVLEATAVASCIVAVCSDPLAAAAPLRPDRGPDVQSVAILDEAIDAVESGDDERYEAIVERAVDGQPWLPDLVIGGLIDGDIDSVEFWREILAEPDIELYSWASVFLDSEREALSFVPDGAMPTPEQADEIRFADGSGDGGEQTVARSAGGYRSEARVARKVGFIEVHRPLPSGKNWKIDRTGVELRGDGWICFLLHTSLIVNECKTFQPSFVNNSG
jgi:hypothetical protein